MTALTVAPAVGAPAPDSRGAAVTAPALRRLPVPVTEPQPALRIVRDEERLAPGSQGVLSLTLDGTSAPCPVDRGNQVHRNHRDHRGQLNETAISDFCQPIATPSTSLPDARRWAGQFVQAAIEVAAGLRPPSQLVRWTSEEVQACLTRRASLAKRLDASPTRRAVVGSVRVCHPQDGVAEASAVVTQGERARAVAVRMEGLDGRWRVTALEFG